LKRRFKYYLVIENSSKQLYGAFPHTEEGRVRANKYIRKIGGKKKFSLESK
tara:strand:+ start:5238 stop:5390 length:153 start_codon:yes stop_codon:yes gene_type:complete